MKPSHLQNKKYDAVVDGKKQYRLVRKAQVISLNIKMKREKRDI